MSQTKAQLVAPVGILTVTASISAGGTTGTSGQVLQSTGTGVTWSNVNGLIDQGKVYYLTNLYKMQLIIMCNSVLNVKQNSSKN